MGKREKSKSVIWSERAKTDLERIFDHVAKNFTDDLAIETVENLISEIGTLSTFPRKGSISILYNEIRELVVDGNTVYYRNNELDVVIATIRPRRTR